MTTSLSSSCKLIAALSVVCLLVCMPSESEARSCVFGCMTSLFKCKRMAALEDKENAGAVCCELYEECFLDCKPNADKLPPWVGSPAADFPVPRFLSRLRLSVYLSACLCVCLYVCSVYLLVCLCVCLLSACLFVCLHCLPACLSACLFVCLPVCSACLLIHLPVCLSVCLPVCLSACLSTSSAVW